MNNSALGWLPLNGLTEETMANAILQHATKSTTYDLTGIAQSQGLTLTEINNLTRCERYLPDACTISTTQVEIRQNKGHAFASFSWKDKSGCVREELELRDDKTGDWYIASSISL
ncbi:MAG: hypothetical protein P4L31_00850 [Candidatus Babeliales bacterium]|nr:hypothetical protein [Candidatus Babeliales bacterium]